MGALLGPPGDASTLVAAELWCWDPDARPQAAHLPDARAEVEVLVPGITVVPPPRSAAPAGPPRSGGRWTGRWRHSQLGSTEPLMPRAGCRAAQRCDSSAGVETRQGGDGVPDRRETPPATGAHPDGRSRRREGLELRDGLWGSTGRWGGWQGSQGSGVRRPQVGG